MAELTKETFSSLEHKNETALSVFGITSLEEEIYFLAARRGSVTVEEVAIKIDRPESEIMDAFSSLMKKGLVTPVRGAVNRYRAVPLYPLLIKEVSDFIEFLRRTRDELSPSLEGYLKEFENEVKKITAIKDIESILQIMKDVPVIVREALETGISSLDVGNVESLLPEIDQLLQTIRESLAKQEEILNGARDTLNVLIKARDETMNAAKMLPEAIEKIGALTVKAKETFSTMESLYQKIDESRENLKRTIEEKLSTAPEIGEEDIESAFAGLTDARTSFNEAIKNEFEILKKRLVDVAAEAVSPVIDPIVQQLSSFLNEQINKMIDLLSKVDPIAELEKKMIDMERKIAENLSYQLDEVSSKFRDVVQMRELTEVLPKLAEESPQKMEEYFNRFSEMTKGLREEITSKLVSRLQLGAMRGFFQKQVEVVLTDALKKMEEFYRSEIITAVQNVLISADQQVNDAVSKISTQMGYIHMALIDMVRSAITTVFSEEQKLLNEMKAAYAEDLKKIADDILASLQESANQMRAQILEETKGLSEEVLNTFRSQIEELSNKIGDIFDLAITDMKNKIRQTLNTISQKIIEINKSLSQTLLGTVDDAFENIKSVLRESTSMIMNEISRLSEIADDLKGASMEQVNNVSKVLDSIVNVSSSSISRIEETLNEIKPKAEENIKNVELALKKAADTLSHAREQMQATANKAVENISVRLSDIESRITKISETTLATFESIRNILKNRLVNAIMEHIEGSIDKLLGLNEVLQHVASMTSKAEEEFKQVWFIESREAMIAEVSRMATKAKARLHVVAPSLDEIDVDTIASLPMRVNVRLTIGRVDRTRDREKINKLAKKDGLVLKVSGNQEIFGAERDGEEVALCAVAGNDVMGIASTLSTHAAIFRSTLESIWLNAREKILG